MKVYVVYHTDIWLSYSSYRMIGIAESIPSAIRLARKDKDAFSDVRKENGHIVINSCALNENDEGHKVLSTESEKDERTILYG